MTKSKNLLKLLAIISIVLVSVCALTGCGKKNKDNNSDEKAYLEPLKNYFDGIKEKDLNKVLSAFPDFMDMSSNITMTEIDELYNYYEGQYGKNVKINYEFGDAVALGEDELSELEDEIKSAYTDVEGVNDIDLTAGYTVTIKVTISGDGVEQAQEQTEENSEEPKTASDTVENEMYVIQYNGHWYAL